MCDGFYCDSATCLLRWTEHCPTYHQDSAKQTPLSNQKSGRTKRNKKENKKKS